VFGLTGYGQLLTATSLPSPSLPCRAALQLLAICDVSEPPLPLARLIEPQSRSHASPSRTAARTPHRPHWRSQLNGNSLNGRHGQVPGRRRQVAPCAYPAAATHRWQPQLPPLVLDPACGRCGTRYGDVPGPGRSRGHGTAAFKAGRTQVTPLLVGGPFHTASGTGGRTGRCLSYAPEHCGRGSQGPCLWSVVIRNYCAASRD
jgi:hypothetical protein